MTWPADSDGRWVVRPTRVRPGRARLCRDCDVAEPGNPESESLDDSVEPGRHLRL